MNVDREHQNLASLKVPFWAVIMVLSPPIGFLIASAIDQPSGTNPHGWPIGLAIAIVGPAFGAMLPKGTMAVRLLRGAGGAILGGLACALIVAAVVALSVVLKGN